MALTTNKRNKIIAEWKAGIYPSMAQLAKVHKVSAKTISRITKDISQDNAYLLEVQTALEIEKRSLKSPIEVAVIDREVIKRTKQAQIDGKIQIKSRKILNKFLSNMNKGIEQGDYQDPEEILTGAKAIETIVKVVTPKEPTSIINNSNSNAQQTNIQEIEVKFE